MHQIKFKLSIDLPPSNIRRPILEMKLLREALNRDESFIKGLSMKITFKKIPLLSQLRNPQSKFLPLRSCMSIINFFI